MAQKATKTLATRNSASLARLHTYSLSTHAIFILLRLLFWRALLFRSFLTYFSICLPSLLIELYLERASRPTYAASGDLLRAGDDLDARGMTEFLFDVVYWTWGTTLVAAVVGDKGWWAWGAVPIYGVWMAWKTLGGVKSAMGGLAGAGGKAGDQIQSKRQAKMEKKGGQRVQYKA